MLGILNEEKLDELLNTKVLGRIGCHANGVTYIVPIHYSYEAPFIYAHSAEGLKIDLMRKNPEVCFQLDEISDFFNWQSVICWGTFEEVTDINEQQRIMQKITNRIEPFLHVNEDAHPSHGIAERESDIGMDTELVVYRIRLNKKTGRFEHREQIIHPRQEQ